MQDRNFVYVNYLPRLAISSLKNQQIVGWLGFMAYQPFMGYLMPNLVYVCAYIYIYIYIYIYKNQGVSSWCNG